MGLITLTVPHAAAGGSVGSTRMCAIWWLRWERKDVQSLAVVDASCYDVCMRVSITPGFWQYRPQRDPILIITVLHFAFSIQANAYDYLKGDALGA